MAAFAVMFKVGMLLSGGIDSSLIASVAGPRYLEASGSRLLAFTAAVAILPTMSRRGWRG